MHWNHPETILTHTHIHQSTEKLSFTKLVPGAKQVGDHCPKAARVELLLPRF